MRLIDADALNEVLSTLMTRYLAQGHVKVAQDYNWAITVLDGAQTIVDAVIVTRCKDCKYLGRELDKGPYSCDDYNLPYCEPDSYCSHGRRKEEAKHAAD